MNRKFDVDSENRVHEDALDRKGKIIVKIQKYIQNVAVVAFTLVFSYLTINWVVFIAVGVIFNLMYLYITATVKFVLGGMFSLTGVYFLVSTGEEGRVNNEANEYEEMEDEEDPDKKEKKDDAPDEKEDEHDKKKKTHEQKIKDRGERIN